MKDKTKSKLAIFDTFKTKDNDLTGEAKRQRAIITILGSNVNPAERTRTGISQKIAKKQNITWKNIYSGIFRDLDEILLPMEIAEEDGSRQTFSFTTNASLTTSSTIASNLASAINHSRINII